MITVDCNQGSPEWLQARCGVTTASMFAECCARLKSGPDKGRHTKKARDYAFKLAVERISRELVEEENFTTWQMRRGHELEPDARLAHEERKGILVRRVGFAMTDDRKFGCSLDGEIGEDGISEYKAFTAPSSMMPILFENDIGDIKYQAQGGLWITGRKWCDFCLYCPQLKSVGKELTIIEHERDDDFIEEMESQLWEFDRLVTKYENQLRGE